MTVPVEGSQPPSLGDIGREGLMAPPGTTAVVHDGSGRVQLSFTLEGGQDRDVRVPPGVSVFKRMKCCALASSPSQVWVACDGGKGPMPTNVPGAKPLLASERSSH